MDLERVTRGKAFDLKVHPLPGRASSNRFVPLTFLRFLKDHARVVRYGYISYIIREVADKYSIDGYSYTFIRYQHDQCNAGTGYVE